MHTRFSLCTSVFALSTLILSTSAFAGVESVRRDNGANAAAIQGAVDAYRNDLGTFNAPAPVNAPDGRRQINWDAAPDRISAPNPFPGNFFNANVTPRARGIAFFTPGTGFQLSATAASGVGVEFDNLSPGLSTEFDTFSAERLFTPIGSNITDVFFFDPTNPASPAVVDGLGVVFTGVDAAGVTKIEFFNANGDVIATETVTPQPGNGGLSFLGVKFDQNEVARARITSGSATLQVGFVSPGDAVAMDDFIFGEPDASAFAVPNFSATPGLAPNQAAVGASLESLFANPATDPALRIIAAMVAGGTPAQQGAWLDALSPEMHDTATASALRGTERFLDAIEGRFYDGTGIAGQETGKGAIWARSGGGIFNQDGGPGHTGHEGTYFDLQGGADAAVTPNINVGASLGLARTDADTSRRSVEVTQVTGALYGHAEYGAFAVDGSIAYGVGDVEAVRPISFTAAPGVFVNRTASADYDVDQISGRLTGSYLGSFGATTVRPYAGLEAIHSGGDTFTETGAGNLGLTVDISDETRISGIAGLDLGTDIAMGGMTLTPTAGVEIKHHFAGNDRDISASFTGAPAGVTGFTVESDAPDTTLALNFGLGMTFEGGVTMGARYKGEFGDGFDSHGAEAFFTVPF